MANPLFERKPLALLLDEVKGENRLRRVLGPVTLTSLGVGAIIGTGIFVLTGVAAHDKTGPALALSFALAGVACIFAALCYAEFASMVPVAGSAYTYAYATLGELLAWIIGWDLVLEYTVASSAVAHGWSAYFQDLLGSVGVHIPFVLGNTPFDYHPQDGSFPATGAWMDLVSIGITIVITAILVKGIKESASINTAMVVVKLAVVLFVIVAGVAFIDPGNWTPFAPYGYAGFSLFGHTVFGQSTPDGAPLGVLAGAAIMFFAYIGFDSISTHAEEARQPQRNIPIGIIASLVICTVLYIAVSVVLTGMVPYDQIDINAPVADAFRQKGLPWARRLIDVGAITGITSVMLVMMLSQPRILLAMSRDGLLPKGFFAAIHDKFRTPWKSTILTGVFVALLSGFIPLRVLAELTNIGTLFAFVIVCAAVLVMRVKHPEAERPFRAPLVPLVPILGILFCLALMLSLPTENWVRLGVWLAVGFLIYFGYGRRHSVLAELRKSRQR
ncbi:MAG: amino acid permease [Acidobacteriota bacterium]|jgi:APA family basic amino acid/polyamine antiporter|nr:amino acid permease [Acidobacteriota bacterium]